MRKNKNKNTEKEKCLQKRKKRQIRYKIKNILPRNKTKKKKAVEMDSTYIIQEGKKIKSKQEENDTEKKTMKKEL